jgi:hypothetical protein
MKEWDDLDRKQLTVLNKWFWGTVIAVVATFLYCLPALAVPMAEASYNHAKIVLTDEACKLSAIKNLPRRAVWTEKGKTFEGCWEVHQFGFVIAYFDDQTIAVIPADMFKPITGA